MSRPLFQLDPRLWVCAQMVRTGTKLADIGTDHAYLPVWMEKQELISSAVAADINPGPLARAKENIARYQAQSIATCLSNGLESINPDDAQDIVIAGMGGELIIRILSAAPWVKEGNRRLILQPMTGAKEVREYLQAEGFFILQEKAVEVREHIYTVMQAEYQPTLKSNGALYPYVGVLDHTDPMAQKYIQKQAMVLRRRGEGLLRNSPQDGNTLLQTAQQLEEWMKREEQPNDNNHSSTNI